MCDNSETNFAQTLVANLREAEDFARKIGFPEHWLLLRPDNERHQSVVKGINKWEHLKDAVKWGFAKSAAGKVFLETDMRAHANPTRMRNIQKAAEDLAKKIKQQCPWCRTPGFSVTVRKKGLPCEWCGRPTQEIKARVFTCGRCGFSKDNRQRGGGGSC